MKRLTAAVLYTQICSESRDHCFERASERHGIIVELGELLGEVALEVAFQRKRRTLCKIAVLLLGLRGAFAECHKQRAKRQYRDDHGDIEAVQTVLAPSCLGKYASFLTFKPLFALLPFFSDTS